ncbi:hypothetical protein A9Q74_08210 [Colwellia sp. 39_35_sub15_T18]|nr:hypothetical protein A9Q74_08210 [Colwellia sp. 39_35_sub15_T18]
MTLKNIFQVSIVAGALALAGCGGDINVTPTVNDTSVDNSTNNSNNVTETPVVDTNPCATRGDLQGAYDGQDCVYSAAFASKNVEITEDLTFADLASDGVHVFNGALLIGKNCDTTTACTVVANGPTLTVEAGADLAFDSGEAIIRIARGAKINAIGTLEKPINFTSANSYSRLDVVGDGAQFADWGGIIINGFGITNQCTDVQRDATTCNAPTEGVLSHFGGNDNADNSGTIQYAKIWYAGSGPKTGGAGDDLNSLTLNAVGSGSSFDYIHIHQGFDDGIEFFGGASTLKHIVVTDTQDDGIDIDGGWQGKAQYILVKHGTVESKREVISPAIFDKDGVEEKPEEIFPAGTPLFMGNNGFETDGEKNSGAEYSQAPASNPTIANVTVITTDGKSLRDGDPSQAFKFDDAIQGAYYNVLMVKTDGTNGTDCVQFKGDGEKSADQLSFTSSAMACVNEFKGDTFGDSAPVALQATAKTAWFDNSGANERIGGNASVLVANGFATDTASTDITVTADDLTSLNDDFFETVDYVGAVSDQDTGSNWYKWVETAITAADQD